MDVTAHMSGLLNQLHRIDLGAQEPLQRRGHAAQQSLQARRLLLLLALQRLVLRGAGWLWWASLDRKCMQAVRT